MSHARQLSPFDAQFLRGATPEAPGHFSALLMVDGTALPEGRLTADRLAATIESRLPDLGAYRWRAYDPPLGDLPYWVADPAIDLDHHVREIDLGPGTTIDQVIAAAEVAIARPLDSTRPLWECVLLHGLPGRTGLVMKLHHAASDGMEGLSVLSRICDTSPRIGPAAPANRVVDGRCGDGDPELPGVKDSLMSLGAFPAEAIAALPVVLANMDHVTLLRTLPGAGRIARSARAVERVLGRRASAEGPPMARAPRTAFNHDIDPTRRVAFAATSLDEVKEIRTAFGTSVNDVVVAVTAGALRRYLGSVGAPTSVPLNAFVPMNVRSEDEQGSFGNRFGMSVPSLPVHESDPVRRLRLAKAALDAAKAIVAEQRTDVLRATARLLPPPAMAPLVRFATHVGATVGGDAPATLTLSNLPGAPVPLYVAGARVQRLHPASAIFPGIGLNLTVISYQGELEWGLVASGAATDDLRPLAEAIVAEQRVLLEAARSRAAATA